ncbi:DUF1826 domain-containing protein [Vibrio fluminensis]|uniref:DUF1826 domain-containing protein n=1 Tax=Vibrio fluminensis TaxID=2783614 RepID=UPI0018888634|nr:DUF1826 domain-containing protein [Vibrio fluminensis]
MGVNQSIDKDLIETRAAALPIAVSDKASVLSDIYKPEHNIVIWQREIPAEVNSQIQAMLSSQEQLAIVSIVTPDDAAKVISNKLGDHVCSNFLAHDVALIVDMFCCLFDVREVGLRLTMLDKPMCPNFHVDQVPCRLVSTYLGQATQWLASDDVERSTLAAKHDAVIRGMSAGDIALLKGGGWAGNEDNAIVHRSPEVKRHERRLLLTLDMV